MKIAHFAKSIFSSSLWRFSEALVDFIYFFKENGGDGI